MLSANEFTVGALADATPLALMLPRTKYEATVLIGQADIGPAAVFLGDAHAFHWFECSGNKHWNGLIVPSVRIEVDETSVFDP